MNQWTLLSERDFHDQCVSKFYNNNEINNDVEVIYVHEIMRTPGSILCEFLSHPFAIPVN